MERTVNHSQGTTTRILVMPAIRYGGYREINVGADAESLEGECIYDPFYVYIPKSVMAWCYSGRLTQSGTGENRLKHERAALRTAAGIYAARSRKQRPLPFQ
jgi:hypothetical protein